MTPEQLLLLGRRIRNEFRKLDLRRGRRGFENEDVPALAAYAESLITEKEREELVVDGMRDALARAQFLLVNGRMAGDGEELDTDLRALSDARPEEAVAALLKVDVDPKTAAALVDAVRKAAAEKDDVRPFRPKPKGEEP